MPAMANAIVQELALRKNYLSNPEINTIYFGGGTPGIMQPELLQQILVAIHQHFSIINNAEITIEVNPDDMSLPALTALQQLGFNRLSVGIQSFFEQDLKWMNRAHNAQQAEQCIRDAHQVGFTNISADLIYGYSSLSDENLISNLDNLKSFDVPHLSCYNLTVEPKTALFHQVQKGQASAPSSEQGAHQFNLLMQWAAENNYQHYEISNFALPNMQAVHNTNYWNNASYLGLGPGAHSFNGNSRQWNVANNAKYIDSISNNILPAEIEHLSRANKINEYLLTKLRTADGLSFSWLAAHLNAIELDNLQQVVAQNSSCFVQTSQNIALSNEGKLFADGLASDMFVDG
jgi:putative oxygen-independent coproporphyrinogen III oxidase